MKLICNSFEYYIIYKRNDKKEYYFLVLNFPNLMVIEVENIYLF